MSLTNVNLCCCDQLRHAIEESAIPIEYLVRTREVGVLIINSKGPWSKFGTMNFTYCPWCGCKLPPSLGDKWYEMLEAIGVEDPNNDPIPLEFESDEWYLKRGL